MQQSSARNPEPMSFSFREQMLKTEGLVRETASRTISAIFGQSCTAVIAEDRPQEQKNGIDFRVTLRKGAEVLIDQKLRESGASRFWNHVWGPELALELWSVLPDSCVGTPEGRTGWTLDESKVTDLVLFMFAPEDSREYFLVPFQPLRAAFRKHATEWRRHYRTAVQRSFQGGREWESQCVFAPARVVLAAVGEEMRGDVPSLFVAAHG
jgi:hypothetical protein